MLSVKWRPFCLSFNVLILKLHSVLRVRSQSEHSGSHGLDTTTRGSQPRPYRMCTTPTGLQTTTKHRLLFLIKQQQTWCGVRWGGRDVGQRARHHGAAWRGGEQSHGCSTVAAAAWRYGEILNIPELCQNQADDCCIGLVLTQLWHVYNHGWR